MGAHCDAIWTDEGHKDQPEMTDKVLEDWKDYVNKYVDDCIVFYDDMESHIADLRHVLSRLKVAGFTLQGFKCCLGRSTIIHLGFRYTWWCGTSRGEVSSISKLANANLCKGSQLIPRPG